MPKLQAQGKKITGAMAQGAGEKNNRRNGARRILATLHTRSAARHLWPAHARTPPLFKDGFFISSMYLQYTEIGPNEVPADAALRVEGVPAEVVLLLLLTTPSST